MDAIPYKRLSGFYFFYFALLGAIIPYWSLYLESLAFDAITIGVLMSISHVTRVFAPSLWGYLADRTGKRLRIIRLGALATWIILSDTYQAAYAAVTHAYLDLTDYSQRLMNETFEQFGLCTQAGMTKVFERQHATRKELSSVQKALKEQQVLNDTLAKQLAELEHKVMTLATHSIDDQ
jgi:hypothetical protein